MGKTPVILITGCSSGLGFALAKKFNAANYVVYAGVRNLADEPKLLIDCKNPSSLHVLHLDLSQPETLKKAFDQIIVQENRIDILINNAAAIVLGPVDATTYEECEYLFKVNVFSLIQLGQLVIPHMRKQKNGHIVTIGSISSIESSSYLGVYSATKFAQESLMLSWASTLNQWNIQCTMIEPGAMNTKLPSSIKCGSYYKDAKKDPYKLFNKNTLKLLRAVLAQGLDPNVVAKQVFEIIENKSPCFRYATCDYSENLLKRHLVDPKGNDWIKEHQDFVRELSSSNP